MSEFMQAALIMIEFQKLAIIVDSINLKLKKTDLYSEVINKMNYSLNVKNNEENKLNIITSDILYREIKHLNMIDHHSTQDNYDAKSAKSDLDEHSERDFQLTADEFNQENDKSYPFERHCINYCSSHKDFDVNSNQYRSYLEFNWNDHAYYILQDLYPEGVECFHKEINYITNLTTNSLASCNLELNTFPFRNSICYYIEKILGYIHEDYDYSIVNRLLNKDYKKFIKNVTCFPQRLNNDNFKTMSVAFSKEEILHMILLAATVKCRTQLTYLASALYNIIKDID
jgi:hypothetical protein